MAAFDDDSIAPAAGRPTRRSDGPDDRPPAATDGPAGRSPASAPEPVPGPVSKPVPGPVPGAARIDSIERITVAAGRPAAPGRGAARAVLRAGGRIGRVALPVAAILLLWQAAVILLAPPRFLLPAPLDVVRAFAASGERIAAEAAVTLLEAVLGLAGGILAGVAAGVATAAFPLAGRVLTPVLVASQALPVFALAPLLVLWFGFGLASKIVMATLAIFFPVASGLADGLARTDPGLLDLARLAGAGRVRTLLAIRLPAALPALVSGIRVAAVYAPIGAVIGEWVGASRGLGLLMVQANARMQTDLLFAALAVLALAALALKAVVDRATAALIPWAEPAPSSEGSS